MILSGLVFVFFGFLFTAVFLPVAQFRRERKNNELSISLLRSIEEHKARELKTGRAVVVGEDIVKGDM